MYNEKYNFVSAIPVLSKGIRTDCNMHYLRWLILRFCILTTVFTQSFVVNAQEMWGITTSNYAGSSGATLNPATLITTKLYFDLNIVTADIFFQNNYAYIHRKDYSLFKFISKSPEFPKYGEDEMPFDHYYGTNDKYIYASELIKGPSAMLAYGRHAFAIHTGARVLTSANGIPYDIANFGYYGLDYAKQHNIDYNSRNITTSALILGEIGISYAYAFRKISMDEWAAGFTIKRYFSPGGAYASVNDLNYIVVNDSTINIKNLDGEVGYSYRMDYDDNSYPDDGPFIKGGGFGLDIGFTFQDKALSYQKKRIRRLCSQKYIDYYYRFGFSILDLGYINFKNNAMVQDYNNVSKYWIDIDTIQYHNMNQLTRTLSNEFYGDPDASYAGNKVKVMLPTAISVQGDYRIYRRWYAGAVWILPVRLGKSYMRRPAQVVVIPRYESPKMEFSIPVSLYDYRTVRVGAAFRYYFLTVGTDDLMGLMGLKDFTGIDFYFSLKINFRKGYCGRFKRNLPCENEEYGIRRRY